MSTVRFMLMTIATLLITVPAMAQEKPKRKPAKLRPTSQAMLRMMKLGETLKQLDLTDEQKQKLKKIHEETGPKMKGILDKVNEILTEEQSTAAKEAAKKAMEAGKKGRDFVLAIQSSIQLTDEQQAKMDKVAPEIQAVQRQMMKAIAGMLTPEQKEKMKQLRSPRKKKSKKTE